MKDVSSLKKKLAGYSAMAGAVLAGNHHADAQVVYHDIAPDTVLYYYSPTYYLDLNSDSMVDFRFSWATDLGTFNLYGVLYLSSLSASVLVQTGSGFHVLGPLSSCENILAIPPSGNSWDDPPSAFMSHNGASPWPDGVDGYAGIRFHLADGYHYGWIRMSCNPIGNYGSMTLKDYAYQSIPDSAITTPCPQQINEMAENLFNAFIENHHLILHFPQSTLHSRIILFNEVGVKLNEQAITQSQMVMDVSNLAAGVYLVAVDDVEKRQVKKVVIE